MKRILTSLLIFAVLSCTKDDLSPIYEKPVLTSKKSENMARIAGHLITWDDISDMVNIEGYTPKHQSTVSGKKCLTRSEIEAYIYCSIDGSYASNQLVKYSAISKGIQLSPTSASFNSNSGSESITLTSPATWTIESKSSWVSTSPTGGSGNSAVTISVTTNSGSARSGYINFKLISSGQIATLDVYQSSPASSGNEITVSAYPDFVGDGEGIVCGSYSSGDTITAYIPSGQVFETATGIYNDAGNSSPASAGWYSNGTVKRHWTGSVFDETSNCQ